MAKIESGHAEWHNTDVDLVALCARRADRAGAAARARRQLELELPAAVPPLRADPDRLTQVLLNLLSNAAKFVPGRAAASRCGCAPTEGATVEVQDNGPGVPAAQRALIFEKFRQGGDAATGRRAPAWACRSAARSSSTSAAAWSCGLTPVKAPASPSRYLGPSTPEPAAGCASGAARRRRRRRQPMTTRSSSPTTSPTS
jgi:hypothetical protein